MCTTCGCSDGAQPTLTNLQTGRQAPVGDVVGGVHEHTHDHDHSHDHAHDHSHDHAHDHHHDHPNVFVMPPSTHPSGRTIKLEQDLLAKNSRLAERNRGWLAGRNVLALNLISSPGAGKTTLLERTLHDMREEVDISVIEGDQATLNDARRIQATGCRVVQINTGAGCHLEADMIAEALRQLDPSPRSMVMVENVGNLVCPALFDLGEHAKVVIASVTEGDDKPLKYPHIFRAASVVVLNKMDLLPHVQFDVERFADHAKQVNARLHILKVSATQGDGMEAWYAWLRHEFAAELQPAPSPASGVGREGNTHRV